MGSHHFKAVGLLANDDQDTGRLLTIFDVKLESIKKIENADVVIGIDQDSEGPLAIVRTQDPNKNHPLRQKDILEKIADLHRGKFTPNENFSSHVFQAILWKHNLKDNRQFCWESDEGALVKYSRDVVTFIRNLTENEIEVARVDYSNRMKPTRGPKAAI